MQENANNSLSSVFGLPPIQPERKVIHATIDNRPVAPVGMNMADDDYAYARENMRDAIAIAMQALNDAAVVAAQSQQANAFVSVAQIAKSVTDASKTLLDLSQTHKNIAAPTDQSEKTTHNNLFVGSTTDLLKMIQKKDDNV